MSDVILLSVDEALREKKRRALGLIAPQCEKAIPSADYTTSADVTMSGLTKVNLRQLKCAKALGSWSKRRLLQCNDLNVTLT